jgi:Uncharacterized protein conserved in bacteria (DUF2334)
VSRSGDAQRTLRLHVAASSSATAHDLGTGAARTVDRRRAAGPARRNLHRLGMKVGALTYQRSVLETLVLARTAVLGPSALGPPRFLIRVDEFPHYLARDDPERYGTTFSRRFHRVLADQGVRYLMAIVPQPAYSPLDPLADRSSHLDDSEIALIAEMKGDRVMFGLHGLTHRTRFTDARRRSELDGIADGELTKLLERGTASLTELGVDARVFVPPYNRFERAQYQQLARRFDIICGGPESVTRMGFLLTPSWLGDAVYMPSYPPFYARASEILPAARMLLEQQVGTWIPIVLHTGWESEDDYESLAELARLIAPYAADWGQFLEIAGSTAHDN